MSKEQGYCLRIQRDIRIGIGLVRTGTSSWILDDVTTAAASDPLPGWFQQNVSAGGNHLTWMVPDEDVRAVMLSLPLLKGQELQRGVLGTVARQEKRSPEDLVVSWRVLGERKEPGGETAQDLVSLVMHRGSRDENLELAKGLDVSPSCMLPSYAVLDEMFRLAGPPVPDSGAWALVYLGRDENFLNISSAASLLLTRALPVNLGDDQDQQGFLARLGTEIDRSRFFIRQGANSPEIQQVVVCGDPDLANPLVDHLNSQDSGLIAVHWAAEHLFSHNGQPVATEFLLPALGAALALESPAHNLLEVRRRRLLGSKARRRIMLAGTAAAVGLVPMVLAGSVLTARINENYLTKAKLRLEEARTEAQQAAEVYKTSRLLDNQELCLDWKDHERLDVHVLLSQLAKAAPEDVVFRNVRILDGEQGGFKLQIVGDSRGKNAETAQASYLEFQGALNHLQALEGFTEPRILEIGSVRKGSAVTPLTRFSLDLEIAPRAPEQS
ncbi:hypothetical protein CO151_01500 [bacterium CG_4_9_14_3_um_filter_65_15]|nr:MAG: hypothetical protein CO151_01500 [bacterium CG_4_9_14_3_um_filter_65_15]